MNDLRHPQPGSWIARERVFSEPVPVWAWIGSGALALASFLLLAGLAVREPRLVAAEQAFRDTHAPYMYLMGSGVHGPRIFTAFFGALLVWSTFFVGMRLLHSPGVGLLAAALVAFDPGVLVVGHLGLDLLPPVALAMTALGAFLHPSHTAHWIAVAMLALSAFLEPRILPWTIPLLPLVLLRGHIYAAPKHLGMTAVQVLLVPGLAALLGLAVAGGPGGLTTTGTCLRPDRLAALFLGQVLDLGSGFYVLHNPATWFAGLGTLLWLAFSAGSAVVLQFRVQRLPGRLQVRFPKPLDRIHGRALWLAALALFAPTPLLWLPLFAVALAAGVRELAQDAPGFGALVGTLVVAFAVVYSVRLWGIVTGAAPADTVDVLVHTIPWSRVLGC